MKKYDNLKELNINSTLYKTRLSDKYLKRKPFEPLNPGLVSSFIPGTVVEILVTTGQKVKKGDDLLILDAMKMQNRLKSPADATVKEIKAGKGSKVAKGDLLLILEL